MTAVALYLAVGMSMRSAQFAVCILILILSVAIMDVGISSSILILKNSMRVQHTSFSFSVEMSGGCPC